jgi:HlyD family secretion protein
LAILIGIAAAAIWYLRRPKLVAVVTPSQASITETIASSARIGGVQETAVGAQFTGTVEKLFVKEGDHVKAGQPLAVLKNDISRQQKIQAEKAVDTARSQLAQVSKGPSHAELAEAEHLVAEARAQAAQANADLAHAQNEFGRSKQMAEHGIISDAEYQAAETRLASAKALAESAASTINVRKARLSILRETPKPEDVQVARDRLAEAQQALSVAQEQLTEATVRAPFSGVVTQVNAEQGQTVGSTGVVDLVSDDLEIRMDLDENNLPDLAVGQPAVISSSAFSGKTFDGRVSDIGAAVNQQRGTIQVTISPINPPDWFRPGQTVNVNLITNQKAERLMLPAGAIQKRGDRTVVFVMQNGRALEKVVLTRPATARGVPIVAGVTTADRVIVDASGIAPGEAVRVRRK